MLRFFTRVFAVIGFLIVVVIATGGGFAWYSAAKPVLEPNNSILVLKLDEDVTEQDQPSPFDFALDKESTSLLDILQAIKLAKTDPHVRGIVARFGTTMPSFAKGQEIRAALEQFRSSGKFTYAYASSYGDFGGGTRAYYLASVFDNIWLQPVGTVGLTGIAVEMPFAKSALASIGIQGDFLKRAEYKSAMDTVLRDDFQPEVKVETQNMIDDYVGQVADAIADSRKMTKDQVKQLMDKGPFTEDEALKAGLITHIGYTDELEKEIDDKVGSDNAKISVDDYLGFDRPNDPTETKIALIYASGIIVDKGEGPSGIPGEDALGADKVARAFDNASKDKDVKAILFRIDSPGGSPDASETIRRSMVLAQHRGKPVIVSMGDVAASGGYWIAMNADRIIADPATLTGSIGVFAGKFVVGDLIQKAGVHVETLKTGDAAGMWSPLETFNAAQQERLNALLDDTYQTFMKNVSDARKIPIANMADLAKGRVFTGDQAIKNGLVDKLGGFEVAEDEIRAQLKLSANAPLDLETYPAPESMFDRLKKVAKNFGLESASIGPLFMEMQKAEAILGIATGATMKPVEALAPQAALETIR